MSIEEVEEWKSIPEDCRYEVSSLGRARRLVNVAGHLPGILPLKLSDPDKYYYIWVKGKSRMIHHLVLELFSSPRPEGLYALHKNDDKYDNKFSNLYWGTDEDNKRDAVRNGRIGSESHKRAISIHNKEYYKTHPNPMTGKTHTQEIRNGISEKLKEYYSDKPNPFAGKKHTEETRKRMSETKRLRNEQRKLLQEKGQ